MRTTLALSSLVATSLASILPIHGCEWLPNTTAVTNFSYFASSSTTTTPDYVSWTVPAFSTTCNATFTGPDFRTSEYNSTNVQCRSSHSDPNTGFFLQSLTGANATLNFSTYAQCAADIFEIYYSAPTVFDCVNDEAGDKNCVARGNITASVSAANYLPPIRNPPPPPWTPPVIRTTTAVGSVVGRETGVVGRTERSEGRSGKIWGRGLR